MAFPKWIGQLILDILSVFCGMLLVTTLMIATVVQETARSTSYAVFLPWIILQTVAKPYHRGFFCNDESIMHPYKNDTVTNAALTAAGFIVSFVVFAITEVIHFYVLKRSDNPPPAYRLTNSCSIPRYLVMIYKVFGIFLFGMAIQQTITNIGKYSIGRLRPHFLSVCNPDFAALNCSIGNPSNGIFAYIEDDVCRAEDNKTLKEARLSFPSGHSSFATYVAVFLVLYLQSRMTWKGSKLLKHFFQGVLIYLAIYVCLSRISDYKHHWSDVLSGAILGVFVAALTGIHVSSQFKFLNKRSANDLDLPFHINNSAPAINEGARDV